MKTYNAIHDVLDARGIDPVELVRGIIRTAILLTIVWALLLTVLELVGVPSVLFAWIGWVPVLLIPYVFYRVPYWTAGLWQVEEVRSAIKEASVVLVAVIALAFVYMWVPFSEARHMLGVVFLSFAFVASMLMVLKKSKWRSRMVLVGVVTAILAAVSTWWGGPEKAWAAVETTYADADYEHYTPPVHRVLYGRTPCPVSDVTPANPFQNSPLPTSFGEYEFGWDGNPVELLRSFTRSESIALRVTVLAGHLDLQGDGEADPHRWVNPTKPVDRAHSGWCRNIQYQFPDLMTHMYPGESGLVIDQLDPTDGVYPFHRWNGGTPWVRVAPEQSPWLVYMHEKEPRSHGLTLRIEIRPPAN